MRHGGISALAILLLGGCSTNDAQPQDLIEWKAQVKEEIKAELRAEFRQGLAAGQDNSVDEPARAKDENTLDRQDPLPPPIAPRSNTRSRLPMPADDLLANEPLKAADTPVEAEPADDSPLEEAPPGVQDPQDPTPSVSGLDLIQLVLAERVNRTERIPEGPSSSFDANIGKIFAFAVIKNPNERTQVQFQWLREGKVVHSLPLKVGQSKRGWRTWASTRIGRRTAGNWEIRVLDDTGALLGKRAFVVR